MASSNRGRGHVGGDASPRFAHCDGYAFSGRFSARHQTPLSCHTGHTALHLAWIVDGLAARPRPGYKRSLQQLDAYLYQIIAARRKAADDGDDLLGLLVNTPGMSDDLIRDQILTLLIAGHDTSTALLAWTLYLLGRHPNVAQRVRAEVDTVVGDGVPTLEGVARMNYLDQVINETMRLYPPIHIGNRIAATDLSFKGYQIPVGTRVVYSIYLTHRHRAYWPNPEQFEPDRFSAEENRKRVPYTYLPFGGGPRNCIGAAFAQVEAKVVLSRITPAF